MENTTKTVITVGVTINAPVEKVWNLFNGPEHITQWCAASDDWHTPWATNDLREGGKCTSRMEAKDGSMGFEFWWVYNCIKPNELLDCTMGDGRKLDVKFETVEGGTRVTEVFEAEEQNSVEMQQAGWQAILDNFKKYVESH